MKGSVTHFEIPADDVQRAERFYAESFGWNIQDMPEMSYAMLGTTPSGQDGRPKDPGAINGGMMKRSGMFKAPVVTIDVDDIDEALATVEKNGGTTRMGRQAVGDMGFTGYFSDTEGNLIGLWQSAR
ncbi:VOC family protein [Asanoa sp. WMMD1127]|uniref:VOC family protein n=1 Tax=Asanoa sp. WMMD1127 TaxID=3016107 RepID=UPI002416FB5D|nr:VOC family protein [Asanoa sp. WMMD1127]MDG4827559.1 VOC family protein [Asanoa sp. WMMD1127]